MRFPATTAALALFILFCSNNPAANSTVLTHPNQLSPGFTQIDFETFSNGQSFTNPLTIGGVAFTSLTGGLSILDITASGWSADGTEVSSKILFPGGEPDSAISIVFPTPVSEVLLGWGDPNLAGNVLQAFDAAGNLLEQGAVAAGPAGGTHAAWIGFKRASADIAKIIVQPDQSQFSGDDYVIDNIRFNTAQPFASISTRIEAEMNVNGSNADVQVTARLTLGQSSNGINPLTESVTLRVGHVLRRIPAGSFTRSKQGVFTFQGTIDAIALVVTIRPSRGGFELQTAWTGADLNASTLPWTFGLAIGNDAGTSVLTKLVAESE